MAISLMTLMSLMIFSAVKEMRMMVTLALMTKTTAMMMKQGINLMTMMILSAVEEMRMMAPMALTTRTSAMMMKHLINLMPMMMMIKMVMKMKTTMTRLIVMMKLLSLNSEENWHYLEEFKQIT